MTVRRLTRSKIKTRSEINLPRRRFLHLAAGAAMLPAVPRTAAFADPKIRGRLVEMGGTALAGSPAEFGKVIADETEKWGGMVRAANIKPE